jgi:multiple sugar transport system substrate-binding protein
MLAVSAVVMASAAGAQLLEGSSLNGPSQAGRTLTIYGMGGRDDVAQGRLDIATKVIEGTGAKVENPVAGFNDQAFLARLAARDIPDLVYMDRNLVGTYAARNALLPLANCIKSEKINRKVYRQAALNQVTYKGQLYALPEFTNQITLIVNNDVARQAGVNVADIQTTNWQRLRAANKKLLRIQDGRLTRIGFDPKLPEFFPLWVKWSGKDLISKNGLKAQLNSREAVAALNFAHSLYVRLLRANQPDVRQRDGRNPLRELLVQRARRGRARRHHGEVLHEPEGRPDHNAERKRMVDSARRSEPGSRLQVHEVDDVR